MTNVIDPPGVDLDKLAQFAGRVVEEAGATLNTALVVMGDRLGYYRALADRGPLTAGALSSGHRQRVSRTPGSG